MLQGPFIIHEVGLENLIIFTFSAILQPRRPQDPKSLATLSCAWEVGNPGTCERQQAVSVQPYYEAT